jgi:hypothetical protein
MGALGNWMKDGETQAMIVSVAFAGSIYHN